MFSARAFAYANFHFQANNCPPQALRSLFVCKPISDILVWKFSWRTVYDCLIKFVLKFYHHSTLFFMTNSLINLIQFSYIYFWWIIDITIFPITYFWPSFSVMVTDHLLTSQEDRFVHANELMTCWWQVTMAIWLNLVKFRRSGDVNLLSVSLSFGISY